MKKKKKGKKVKQPKQVKDISYDNTPEKELNPNHKEDFENVLRMLVPEIKPKAKKGNKPLED